MKHILPVPFTSAPGDGLSDLYVLVYHAGESTNPSGDPFRVEPAKKRVHLEMAVYLEAALQTDNLFLKGFVPLQIPYFHSLSQLLHRTDRSGITVQAGISGGDILFREQLVPVRPFQRNDYFPPILTDRVCLQIRPDNGDPEAFYEEVQTPANLIHRLQKVHTPGLNELTGIGSYLEDVLGVPLKDTEDTLFVASSSSRTVQSTQIPISLAMYRYPAVLVNPQNLGQSHTIFPISREKPSSSRPSHGKRYGMKHVFTPLSEWKESLVRDEEHSPGG